MPLAALFGVFGAGDIGPHDTRVGETASLGVECLGEGIGAGGADGEVGFETLLGPGACVVET